MNYQAAYNRLITYRQEHPAQGYTERHHIIMRSMGGSDDSTNLVVLTGREHWIAHLLLHKIHRNSQTAHACHMMAMRCEERGIPYVRNSRMYEKIRKECAKLCSIRMKVSQSGKGNSQYGTHWICNTELQENKKISKDADIPTGWTLGRILPKRTNHEYTCNHCQKIFIHNKRIKYCCKSCELLAKPDIIKDNFLKLKDHYDNHRCLSKAFTECNISYNGNLFKKFLNLYNKAEVA